MGYQAKIVLDSINPNGDRLTTFEVSYPRIIHSEFMTHRAFSRNSASSRAIPVEKMIERVMKDPFIPIYWGKAQAGMQAAEELDPLAKEAAIAEWLIARNHAVNQVKQLLSMRVHKQIANRLLEPWMWQTVIVSGTEFENFFKQRCHPDAQPEIRRVADMMKTLYHNMEPTLNDGWHTPYIRPGETETFNGEQIRQLSVARCARVSYLSHDGTHDPQKDFDLYDKLVTGGHWSPFEHVASAILDGERSGNFNGWVQLRKVHGF